MKIISKFYNHLANDSLYRNSIYLMLSTAVMAFLGFFFWIINARLYSTEQVGIATTLISVVTLISSFSLFGFGAGLIRYLPTSKQKNEKINTGFTLVAIASIFISIIYLLGLNIFTRINKYLIARLHIAESHFFFHFASILEGLYLSIRSIVAGAHQQNKGKNSSDAEDTACVLCCYTSRIISRNIFHLRKFFCDFFDI